MRSPLFSLTPNFSWVMFVSWRLKSFQRFSAGAQETVKTVLMVSCVADTGLKPGVNENYVVSAAFISNL